MTVIIPHDIFFHGLTHIETTDPTIGGWGHWDRWNRRWLHTEAFLHSRGDDLGMLLPVETTQGKPENWEDWSCEDGINQVRSLFLFGSFPQDFLAKLGVFLNCLITPVSSLRSAERELA